MMRMQGSKEETAEYYKKLFDTVYTTIRMCMFKKCGQ